MVRAIIFISAMIALIAGVSAAPHAGNGHNDVESTDIDYKKKFSGVGDILDDEEILNDFLNFYDWTIKNIIQDVNILAEDNGDYYDSDKNGPVVGYKTKDEGCDGDECDLHGLSARNDHPCDDDKVTLTKRYKNAAIEADTPAVRFAKMINTKGNKITDKKTNA
ncbi:uncharacterized protein BX663DRAFT_486422 [Cokeromyces recurvatus]|uniref:uncharacterized protein n=1 Tax=Cokeromyces recurvatus TaxID=90255 RepID=UPI00221E3CFF|nr:uncharacterized protein BX663DRAFT_486422 [Cokeromyces recurvatus]KAI7902612.1 hypothetical protein BX663DRAFT_486422 [Cokeromyces recurvatus]